MFSNIYHPTEVKTLFNQMSGTYKRMNYITSFGFSERWRKKFLRKIPAQTEKLEIIDLMTGMGEMWKIIQKRFPMSNITALDFSENMLLHAKQQNEKIFHNQINMLQQDLLQNELPSEHYDIVVCAFGLKTFDNQQLDILAKETKRILKTGGKFTFIEISEPNNWLLKNLYEFYLKRIIPILGSIFLGNPDNYRMLWRYTHQFQNAAKTNEIFSKNGLETTYSRYFGGCATGIHGTKI